MEGRQRDEEIENLRCSVSRNDGTLSWEQYHVSFMGKGGKAEGGTKRASFCSFHVRTRPLKSLGSLDSWRPATPPRLGGRPRFPSWDVPANGRRRGPLARHWRSRHVNIRFKLTLTTNKHHSCEKVGRSRSASQVARSHEMMMALVALEGYHRGDWGVRSPMPCLISLVITRQLRRQNQSGAHGVWWWISRAVSNVRRWPSPASSFRARSTSGEGTGNHSRFFLPRTDQDAREDQGQ